MLTDNELIQNLHKESYFQKEVHKKYRYLGSGIGRKVYDIGGNRVLKYCLNETILEEGEWATILQNKTEVKKTKTLQKNYKEGFANVLLYDPIKFKWIITEKIIPSEEITLEEKLIEVFGTQNVDKITKLFFIFMFPVVGLYDEKLISLYHLKILDRKYENPKSDKMTERGSEAFELFYALAKAGYKHPDFNIDNFVVNKSNNKLVMVDYGMNYKQNQLGDFFDFLQ